MKIFKTVFLVLISIVFLIVQTGCMVIDVFFHPTNPKYKRNVSDEDIPDDKAKNLHKTLFIADMHADSLLFGRDLTKKKWHGHVDFPRMQIANQALQIFTIVSSVKVLGINTIFFTDLRWTPMGHTETQAKRLAKFVDQTDSVSFIKSKGDLEDFIKDNFEENAGRHQRRTNNTQAAALLGVEGVNMICKDHIKRDFYKLYKMGVRLIGLTHQFDNEFAGSSEGRLKGAVTKEGEYLLNLIIDSGVILDLAHASDKSIDFVIDKNKNHWGNKPLLVSHTGIRGHYAHERNLSDRQAIEIAKSGGVIGIMYWKKTVGHRDNKPDIDAVVEAIIYLRDLLEVAGISEPHKHIGLGSDYDGFIGAPFAVDKLNILTYKLLQNDFDEMAVAAIMGENVLRVMAEWLE